MSTTPSDVTSADRLSLTIIFASLAHAALVLGVGFDYRDENELETLPSLDVVLVQRRSEVTPEDADYLAQASQLGGGSAVEKARPQSPIVGQIPKPEKGLAPAPVKPSIPEPQPQTPAEVVTVDQSKTRVKLEKELKEQPEPPTPNAEELIQRSLEIARLEAEIGRNLEAYAKRPRKKFISANTREFEYAAYMQSWVAKVERIGNLNYPDEARRRNLSGSLVLTVGINRSGTIESIEIVKSSGFQVLDEAAIRIVELGAPYAALPDQIRDKVDILLITRTWQFLPGNVLRGD